MKIECPGCHLSGNIDDARVPATGLAMTCPRCKQKFTVERPELQGGAAVAMLDTCPSCQYATFSEEKFAVCPKCGLVVADYQQKLRAPRKGEAGRQQTAPGRRSQDEQPVARLTEEQRRRDEEARKKYGLDSPQGGVMADEPAALLPVAEKPLSVAIAGWGTVVTAVILILFGGSGIVEYLGKVKAAEAAVAALETAESPATLFFQYLLFPMLATSYALVMLVCALQFLALKKRSVRVLQIGAWAGVVLMVLMKVTDMAFWWRHTSADASLGYYATGLLGELLLGALWVAPFLVLAEFLDSDHYERVADLFS